MGIYRLSSRLPGLLKGYTCSPYTMNRLASFAIANMLSLEKSRLRPVTQPHAPCGQCGLGRAAQTTPAFQAIGSF